MGSYWEANMELIDIIPEFNLYEEFWKIYTKNDIIPPQYIAADAKVYPQSDQRRHGGIWRSEQLHYRSGVTIGKGAVVRDSIIMQGTVIGDGAVLDRAIVAENVVIGPRAVLGTGEEVPNKLKPKVYSFGLTVVGENTQIRRM